LLGVGCALGLSWAHRLAADVELNAYQADRPKPCCRGITST
jgi:hypothetical protein